MLTFTQQEQIDQLYNDKKNPLLPDEIAILLDLEYNEVKTFCNDFDNPKVM